MITLLSVAPTTAQSTTTTTPDAIDLAAQRGALIQANFIYGSGGTSIDAYVQSTCDGGATWYDVCNFHFTTTSAIKLVNLRAQTPVTTLATPGDGVLASNTSLDGLLGDRLRVKWQSSGTYAGSTLLVTAVER